MPHTWFEEREQTPAATGARHLRVYAVTGKQRAYLIDLRMTDAERDQ
jgi:hypothetical protein